MIRLDPGLLHFPGTFKLKNLAQVKVIRQHLVPVDSSLVIR